MRNNTVRCHVCMVALLLLVLLSACSTANRGTVAEPVRDASAAFAVSALEGEGTYTPELSVAESGTGVAVTVRAVGAQGLTGALLHVHYDGGQYSPERVEFGGFLGGEGQVVTLALTDVPEIVPLGIVQVGSALVAPRAGDGELATVYFRAEPMATTRAASGVPTGGYNAVGDLSIVAQSAGTATLKWTEKNVGDYNNDSLVGVADLTPIGMYYEQQVDSSSDPLRVGLADGNNDGRITVADITQIGANFGNQLIGYKLYTDAAGSAEYGPGITVLREGFDSEPQHPIEYTFVANVPIGYTKFTVRAMAEEGGDVGPVSNAAEVVDVPGVPDPPSIVTATSDAGTGHQTVNVSWLASPSEDVSTYVVERKLAADTIWGEPLELGNVTSYVDNDPSFVEEPYEYRLHARDLGGSVSTYAYSNAVTPYFVEGPPPPTNVVADNQVPVINSIEVRWESPVDESGVLRYRIFRKQTPGDVDFSELALTLNKYITDYMDTELTPGSYYEYYVTSVGAEADSEPSNVAGNTPSTYVPEIHILSLTTDKTTHCNDASEGVSNLTVTADETPDSVDWSATGGTVTGDGSTATWEPVNGMDPVKVTVTCTVHKGTAEDTSTLDLYVCEEAIKTIGLRGTGIGDPLGSGYLIDFNNVNLLLPLAEGGGEIEASPDGRPLSYYVNTDHVVFHGYFRTT